MSEKKGSFVKKYVDPIAENIALKTYNQFGLGPDHWTVIGFVASTLAIASQLSDHKIFGRKGPAVLNIAGKIPDKFDGASASVMKKLGVSHDSDRGQNLDVLADRGEEWFAAVVRTIEAFRRSDSLGILAAAFTGISNFGPSLLRCVIEAQGKSIPKTGNTVLEFGGTRPGRVLFETLATFFPKIGETTIQPMVDLLQAGLNIYSIIQRIRLIYAPGPVPEEIDQEKIRQAKLRLKPLAIGAGFGIATLALSALILGSNLRRK